MQHQKFKSYVRALLTLRRRASPTPTALTTARPPTSEPVPAESPAVVEEVQTEFFNVDMTDTAVVETIVESFVKTACDGPDFYAFAVFSAPTQETERQELLAAVSEALASCEYEDFEPVSEDGIFAPVIVHGFEDYIIFSSYSALFVVLWTDTQTLELIMLQTESDFLWDDCRPGGALAAMSLCATTEGILSWEWGATCNIVSQSMAITAHFREERYTKITRIEAVTPQEIANTLLIEAASWEDGVFSSASELLALYAAGAFEPEQDYEDARGSTLESFVVFAPDAVLKILSEAK